MRIINNSKVTIVRIILISIIFTFAFNLSETEVRAESGVSYSLLISGIKKSSYDLQLMETILSNNTINPKNSIVRKSYDSGLLIGDGGIESNKWTTWIKTAFGKSTSSDTCYFYFSGHSLWNGSNIKYGFCTGITSSGHNDYYSYDQLLSNLSKYTKGKVIIILDTCFSAEIKKHIGTLSKTDQKRFSIICGCTSNEESYGTILGKQVGVFTKKLYEGSILQSNGYWKMDKSPYGIVTLKELMSYTKYLTRIQAPQSFGIGSTPIFKYTSSVVKLNRSSLVIGVNKTSTLKATVTGKKGTVKWMSSNKSVATVSSKGKVTGKKKGTATITATINGAKATCKVTVTVPVTKVSLNKTSASIAKGKTLSLKANVFPSNATKKTIMWTSSNKKVATVTSNGVVKGVANGTVTITAKASDGSGKKATCNVTVKSMASVVPNVTDKVLKMSMVDAAKYLGLTKRIVQGNMVYYTHKGKTIRDYWTTDNSSFMESYKSFEKKKGLWNIIIIDKTISFYGAKVGMKKDIAHKKIISYKWHVLDERGYSDGEYDIWYENSAYNQFCVITQNGVVKEIEYIPVDD